MEENDMQKAADLLRTKAAEKKKDESESAIKERFKRVLSRRDEAMKRVYEYQDKTGIPADEETSSEFFNNVK